LHAALTFCPERSKPNATLAARVESSHDIIDARHAHSCLASVPFCRIQEQVVTCSYEEMGERFSAHIESSNV
jgi:hypothetical protein